jgi:hypothetical protein
MTKYHLVMEYPGDVTVFESPVESLCYFVIVDVVWFPVKDHAKFSSLYMRILKNDVEIHEIAEGS